MQVLENREQHSEEAERETFKKWGQQAMRRFLQIRRLSAAAVHEPNVVNIQRQRARDILAEKDAAISPKAPSMLIDRFNRHHDYLRISLTERCNLRCTYCMPEEGVQLTPDPNLLTSEEIICIASLFVKHGVKKIRLTGGEPTLRKDLLPIISQLNALRQHGLKTIAMTTNGLVLSRHLSHLVDAGLDIVNISLDTLDKHKYVLMTRRNGMERVIDSIHQAIQLGIKTKVNCVVMRGINDDEVPEFVEWTRNIPLEVRFIEYMPFGGDEFHICSDN